MIEFENTVLFYGPRMVQTNYISLTDDPMRDESSWHELGATKGTGDEAGL